MAFRWWTATVSNTTISSDRAIVIQNNVEPNGEHPCVFTPADTAIQTPNSDTPYSFIGMDLRAEPIVLTVPQIEKERYFSVQLIDAYTFNFAYLGSRATGNGGGSYLIVGPNWNGELPKGITKVIRSETNSFSLLIALSSSIPTTSTTLRKCKRVIRRKRCRHSSAYPHLRPRRRSISSSRLLLPSRSTSPQFFNILNFVLQFCPTDPSETELMARFAKIGIGAGKTFEPISSRLK